MELDEHCLSGAVVYDGALLKVQRDRVRLPDGSESVREYIRHPGAALIVPLFEDGSVLLERQFRYAHRRAFIELPAGKLDPGEPHLATAKRELREETGYVADDWARVAVIHTSVGYTDEAIELFVARKLSHVGAQLDAGEFLETMIVPFAQALEMVRDGRITDAKTVAALLWVDRWGAG